VSELGLFPLGIVLLPGERIPLHIFESRYTELIGECVDEGVEFGLVFADENGLREVGTRAGVVEVVERFDDGRLNIIVEGRDRFRLVELTSGRSFDTGEVEPVVDEEAAPPAEDVDRALELYGRLAGLTGSEAGEVDRRAERLSFVLAARVDFGRDLKQRLLEERSEPARLRLLAGLLEQAVEAAAFVREVRERAARNGHVTRPAV
jgi:ATP-dependent Lon protease